MSSPLRPSVVATRLSVPALLLLLAVGLCAPTAAAPPGVEPVGVWPLRPQPTLVHDFDPPTRPFGSGHRGVDLAGTTGQRVLAALAGRVTYAGRLAGRGVVVVDHADIRTTYEPVTATVEVGDEVNGGQSIGTLDAFGSHCFPSACLHWGWLRDTTYLNPLDLVGEGPVRLLPLAGWPASRPPSWSAPL